MARYMLFIRGADDRESSPAERQAVVQQYIAWAQNLRADGRMLDGDELGPNGLVVRKQGEKILVTDGPYAEGKELIGGYFLIEADSDEHAAQIARECPALARNGAVEVRPIVEH